SRQSVAPQAMHTLGKLIATDDLSHKALASKTSANTLLKRLADYPPLRGAVIYDAEGNNFAQIQRGEHLELPERLDQVRAWQASEIRANLLVELPSGDGRAGHLLMVASSELPNAFYKGTLTASVAILVV